VEPSEPAPTCPEADRRALKLVIRLHPRDHGYQALLSVGADECDPEMRMLEVTDLPAALSHFPELLAAAETRWQTQPRFPSSATRPPVSARAQRTATSSPSNRAPSTAQPPADLPPPRSADAPDQLALFA